MESRLWKTESKVNSLANPPMFDCYRTEDLKEEKVVTYDGCSVDNTQGDMDIETGVFNVSIGGTYQITFLARYVTKETDNSVGSHIYVNQEVLATSHRAQ